MELTINDKTYTFKASLAFVEAMDKTKIVDVNGETYSIGLTHSYTQMHDLGSAVALRDILYWMNVNQKPRIEKAQLETWIEEECPSLEDLIKEVSDFLYASNVSGLRLRRILGPQHRTKD